MRRRGPLLLILAWLLAGVVAGVRLHLRGGVFGEAVPLALSVWAQLVNGAPWLMAGGVAWWAAGRWPVHRDEVLRPLTLHAWLGLAVVVLQQGVLALLRATLLPPGLGPLDPWAALPAELVVRGPAALAVYAVLVAGALIWRAGEPTGGQEVPGAGRGVPPSS